MEMKNLPERRGFFIRIIKWICYYRRLIDYWPL